MKTVSPRDFVERWSDPNARPLFKGDLISPDGCCCAQGDVLRVCGWTDEQLRNTDPWKADVEVAKRLGISRLHSVLIRKINDSSDGCPQAVLTADGLFRVLGPNWRVVLAFGRHIDTLDNDRWGRVAAAWDAACAAARSAAWAAARDATWDAAGDAAWAAAGDAARSAACAAARECVGASHLASPFFLRMFFGDGTEAWIESAKNYVDPAIEPAAAKGGVA